MMMFTSVRAFFRSTQDAILSTTPHARLSTASEPKDFDAILKRMIREVKFYGEALLTIVLYIDNRQLESMALACLLFTVTVYIFLEALSGPSLHKHISNFPNALPILSKIPALSVFITLIALAFTQWEHSFTTGVLSIIASILGVGVAGQAGVHHKLAEIIQRIWSGLCWVVKAKEAVDEEEVREVDARAAEAGETKIPVGDECV